MKKCLVLTVAAVTLFFLNGASAADEISKIEFSAGKRVDNLDWNISGVSPYGNVVNVLSELTWTDLESYQAMAKARIYLDRVYIRSYAGYAFITSGENQDSDYRGDNRTLEYSRSNNKTDDGSLWDFSAGMGYLFRFATPAGALDIIPVAGLSYHKQNLALTDGFQTISPTGDVGPFSGLDSTYEARWAGPWAGVDLSYSYRKLSLLGSFEYHLAYYRAEADWNLRTDFAHPVSFEHWATGTGVVISLGAEYAMERNWSLAGRFDLQDWSASDGTDRTYFSDGTASDTPLNDVNWDSKAIMLGVNYKF
ncbi:MAG: hypothetical protein A3I81_03350 [Deltaproteobacteria bacterium RIFCSPLOWO2_02_FULL_55_12]|nr:MAG: hypothetical protein A3I81_03350 [Deltaproteobacteria bacterium RIFCSPLOWO2_02_FULL_55_12]